MKIRVLLKNRIVQNAGWIIGGKIGQMLINFVIGLLTARYLGPSNYGLISYAAAYTTFFTAICNLGINSVLVKELLDAPEQQGTTMGTALGLRGVTGALSALALAGLVMMVDAGEPVTVAVVSLSGIGLVFQIFETFNYWFQSRLESKVTSIAMLAAFFLTAVYKAVLLALGKSVTWFACANALDYLLLAVFYLIAYGKKSGPRLRFSWGYGKKLLKKSCYFILPALMICIYGQTDKMMLKQMLSETEVGYYATAVQICNVWCFVLAAVIDSLAPSILKAYQKDEARFERLNRQLYAVVFYVSMVVSAGIALLAEPAVCLLYGQAYLPSVAPLRVITWYSAFSYLGVARTQWVVCKDCQKYLIYIYMGAAVSNVLLNFALIPLWGTVGAAVASLAAQVMTVFIVPLFIRPMRGNTKLMLEAVLLKGVFPRKKK